MDDFESVRASDRERGKTCKHIKLPRLLSRGEDVRGVCMSGSIETSKHIQLPRLLSRGEEVRSESFQKSNTSSIA
jgi:hypothetical protein